MGRELSPRHREQGMLGTTPSGDTERAQTMFIFTALPPPQNRGLPLPAQRLITGERREEISRMLIPPTQPT